jgi:hypothetical protein
MSSKLEINYSLHLHNTGIIVCPFNIATYDGSFQCYSEFRLFALIYGNHKGMRKRLKENNVKDWRFDFAFPKEKLLIELQGATFKGGKGGHTSGTGYEDDCYKKNNAKLCGWTVLEFTTRMVSNGDAIKMTKQFIQS